MENSPIFKDFIPGALVRYPSQPSWGIGQVQSCINGKVTINFENVGKKVIDLMFINLELIENAG